MKAINIIWDVESVEELENLPSEIEILSELINCEYEDEISDYITDLTGFCHFGFDLVD